MIVLLAASILFIFPIIASASASTWQPLMTEGTGQVTDDNDGIRVSKIVNATDSYFIYTEFRNPAQQPVDLVHVHYVVNVIDHEGYSHFVGANLYGDRTVSGQADFGYQVRWQPLVPGNYTITSFLISGWETPLPLSTTASFSVNVEEKTDMLAEGQSNNRLKVENIHEGNNTVTIAYTYCDETYPYQHDTTATLHLGEYTPIRSVDAYLIDIRESMASFRFIWNGGTDVCLV